MLKIKLFVAFAFLAFAAGVFLFGNNETQAQSYKTGAKRDEVLEKVADYKVWKQVQKPEKKSPDILKTDVVQIDNSTLAG